MFSAARVYYTTFQRARGLSGALEKIEKSQSWGRLGCSSLSKEGGGSAARVRSLGSQHLPSLTPVLLDSVFPQLTLHSLIQEFLAWVGFRGYTSESPEYKAGKGEPQEETRAACARNQDQGGKGAGRLQRATRMFSKLLDLRLGPHAQERAVPSQTERNL